MGRKKTEETKTVNKCVEEVSVQPSTKTITVYEALNERKILKDRI